MKKQCSCRALGRQEFTRFLQRLAVLLHLDVPSLAKTLLQMLQQGELAPSLDDSATTFSMDSRDAIAQVCNL